MNKKYLVVVAVGVVLIGVGSCCLVNYAKVPAQEINVSITEVVATTTSVTIQPGMKLYRNEKYGYEFQYPSNLVLKEERSSKFVFTDTGYTCYNLLQTEGVDSRYLQSATLSDPSTKNNLDVFKVTISDNKSNFSLSDWLSLGTKFLAKHPECNYVDYIEKYLGNQKITTISGSTGLEGFDGCCMMRNKEFYIAKDSKIFNLAFPGDIKLPDDNCTAFSEDGGTCLYINEGNYRKILSSFKFIE